ncbi:MAG: hypothetical protein AB1571_03865 [Nanoarchaeota archaeon]
MPIVGFNINRILAEKTAQIKDKLNISSNLNIKNIEQEKVTIQKSEDILRFDFEFTTKYEPNIGNILIEGNILYLDEPKNVKDILKKWKKNKEIPPKLMQQIFNTILIRCNIKALELSQEIALPPHLRLPKVETKKPENYIS